MKLTENLFRNFSKNKYLEMLPDFKEKKNQQYTTLVMTLVALSLFGLFAIGPTIQTIVQLQKQLEDSTFVNDKLGEKIKNLGILGDSYTLIQNDIPLVLEAIPQTPTTSTLVGQIQALSGINNISINKLQIFQVDLTKTEEGKLGYSSFIFSIDGKGSYKNIFTFVSTLTNFQRIVTIDSLTITSGSQDQGQSTFNIRGLTYYKN